MGGGSYDEQVHHEELRERRRKNEDNFQYSIDVKRGHDSSGRKIERRVHPELDIFGKVRESRDNEAPSIAVAFVFDVTGSMHMVPRIFREKVPTLMRLLLDHNYTQAKPQVLFGAVGDSREARQSPYNPDEFPFQVGQFEADNRMAKHMSNLILEGGGGGQFSESYELAFAYFGTRTSIDCWEKRGQKGYLFISGDECAHPTISAKDLTHILGVPTERDMPIEEAIKAAAEKYHLFFVVPGGTSYFHEPALYEHWNRLLGAERVIQLEDPALICETVGLAIGLTEGTVKTLDDGIAALELPEYQRATLRNALRRYCDFIQKSRG